MARAALGLLAALGWALSPAGARAAGPWEGVWDARSFVGGAGIASARLTLTEKDGVVTGISGPLDPNGYWPLTVRGTEKSGRGQITLLHDGVVVGAMPLQIGTDGGLGGTGTLYGQHTALMAQRPPAPRAPRTIEVTPTQYALQFSARAMPLASIAPGDTVRTSTLDNEGQDKDLAWRGPPGNTLTGAFNIEGAMPGDTLVVRLDRLTLNRDSAKMFSGALNNRAMPGGALQTRAPGWDRTWVLDRDKGVARLKAPGDRLAGLEVPLRPMIGSIGVAPPLDQAISATDLGFHGGNLDYNRLTAGTTIYLPVYQLGAQLFLGDGHALQGDGEVTGQGLETSLDVTFTVDLIKGKSLGQVWSEDAEFVMVSGVDNSLDDALKMATAGLAHWLKDHYGLNNSEVAAVLGACVTYDIAEVVDPRPHVVARLSKKTLAMIRKAP